MKSSRLLFAINAIFLNQLLSSPGSQRVDAALKENW